MKDWQKVYTTPNLYRVEIVRGILEENELAPVLVDKRDSAYHIGHFEIYVQPEHVLRAIKIIQDEIIFE